ncbi:hypothetical protein F5X96DRAFT_663657 [Biscogniauxia mediterranea]|nr:hypothetical protein F5X96DRAFT_663657 [Biscogniauxia mediterranea]
MLVHTYTGFDITYVPALLIYLSRTRGCFVLYGVSIWTPHSSSPFPSPRCVTLPPLVFPPISLFSFLFLSRIMFPETGHGNAVKLPVIQTPSWAIKIKKGKYAGNQKFPAHESSR